MNCQASKILLAPVARASCCRTPRRRFHRSHRACHHRMASFAYSLAQALTSACVAVCSILVAERYPGCRVAICASDRISAIPTPGAMAPGVVVATGAGEAAPLDHSRWSLMLIAASWSPGLRTAIGATTKTATISINTVIRPVVFLKYVDPLHLDCLARSENMQDGVAILNRIS